MDVLLSMLQIAEWDRKHAIAKADPNKQSWRAPQNFEPRHGHEWRFFKDHGDGTITLQCALCEEFVKKLPMDPEGLTFTVSLDEIDKALGIIPYEDLPG